MDNKLITDLINYLEAGMWKVDSGTYGSGYELCSSCYALKGEVHGNRGKPCELTRLLRELRTQAFGLDT